MKRSVSVELGVFGLLAVLGVTLRLGLAGLPNLTPVAAVALFAGFYFRSWFMAACLPLVILVGSDLVLGGYERRMMLVVYASLMAPVAARGLLRSRWAQVMDTNSTTPRRVRLASLLSFGAWVGASGLVGSLVFFVATNLATWLWFDLYEHSWDGLTTCFVRALPFYRTTLAGELAGTALLFSCWTGWQLAHLPQTVQGLKTDEPR